MRTFKVQTALVASLFFCNAYSEVTIENLCGQDAEKILLEQFVGSGVEVSNAKFNGNSSLLYGDGTQIALFNNNSDCGMLRIGKGLMLCTDNSTNVIPKTGFVAEGLGLTKDELYEFAIEYCPLRLRNAIEKYSPYFACYKYYLANNKAKFEDANYYKVKKETYEELMKILQTDCYNFIIAYEDATGESMFKSISGYHDYSSYDYNDIYKYSYTYLDEDDEYVTVKGSGTDLFPHYAVYLIVRDWNPKYYSATSEELKELKEWWSNSYSFKSKFFYYYDHKSVASYSKEKEPFYEKAYEMIYYKNTHNFVGDKDLAELTGADVNSPAILEFDFSTKDDSVSFNYSFASQEYPHFVGKKYNDAFSFIITDLTTGEQENIAKIPGSNEYVSINNVNAEKNSKYFISNYTDQKNKLCNLKFNGFTTTLTAKAKVVPCRKYHIKLSIGNISDYNYQSAVFLESGSFKSNGLSSKIKYSNPKANGIANGCSNGEVVVKTKRHSNPTTLKIEHIGEAKNGIDYKFPEEIIVPANQDSVMLDLVPLHDIEADSMEIVMVIEDETACFLEGDTLRTFLYKASPISITPNTPECCATELSVEHTGSVKKILWEPADLLKDNNAFTVHPLECPDEVEKFIVTAENIFGCQQVKDSIIYRSCYELEVSADLVTENESSELIADCNEGKIVLHIDRKKGGKPAKISFSTAGTNLEGLPDCLLIPVNETVYEIPLKAQKTGNAYRSEFDVRIDCHNCTNVPTSSILSVSTVELEPLELEKKVVYREKELGGLEMEVKLISGELGDATWTPTDHLASVDALSATLADDADSNMTFSVIATDPTGCQTATSEVTVIKDRDLKLTIPLFLTPNGDEENEVWTVYGLETTEKSRVRIYDRWGKLLMEFNPNVENWDGTYNGKPCPSTDYWYEVDCEELDKVYSGHFTLIRK